MRWVRSEVFALLFGAFVVFLNFGDCHTSPIIGNLDTIFGLRFWPLMDVIYFLGSILLFLGYGWAKGKGRLSFTAKTFVPLAVFLVAIVLISVDDFSSVLGLGLTLPEHYWEVMMWLYPIVSFLAFFGFGEASELAAK